MSRSRRLPHCGIGQRVDPVCLKGRFHDVREFAFPGGLTLSCQV